MALLHTVTGVPAGPTAQKAELLDELGAKAFDIGLGKKMIDALIVGEIRQQLIDYRDHATLAAEIRIERSGRLGACTLPQQHHQ